MKRAPSSLEGAFLTTSLPEQEKERFSSLFSSQLLGFFRLAVEETCQTCCHKEGKTNKSCHQATLFTSLRKGFALLRCLLEEFEWLFLGQLSCPQLLWWLAQQSL